MLKKKGREKELFICWVCPGKRLPSLRMMAVAGERKTLTGTVGETTRSGGPHHGNWRRGEGFFAFGGEERGRHINSMTKTGVTISTLPGGKGK